jgi:hypothetical protein
MLESSGNNADDPDSPSDLINILSHSFYATLISALPLDHRKPSFKFTSTKSLWLSSVTVTIADEAHIASVPDYNLSYSLPEFTSKSWKSNLTGTSLRNPHFNLNINSFRTMKALDLDLVGRLKAGQLCGEMHLLPPRLRPWLNLRLRIQLRYPPLPPPRSLPHPRSPARLRL